MNTSKLMSNECATAVPVRVSDIPQFRKNHRTAAGYRNNYEASVTKPLRHVLAWCSAPELRSCGWLVQPRLK
jgi:hypothetical protein